MKIFGYLLSVITLLVFVGFLIESFIGGPVPNQPGQRVSVAARNVHFLCRGQGQPTIILETGGSSSSAAMRSLQEALATNPVVGQVCSYDRAGYGGSDPVRSARTFDSLTADLERLLVQAELPGPYVLVGVSMGGLMVRHFAQQNMSQVAGMVLLDAAEEEHTFARLPMLNKMQRSTRVASVLARIGVMRAAMLLFPQAMGIPSNLPLWQREEIRREASRVAYWQAAEFELGAYFATQPEQRTAGGFGQLNDVPLRVITHGVPFAGGSAFLESGWREAQERLAALSTASELIVATNSGHNIAADAQALVVETVAGLILGLPGTN